MSEPQRSSTGPILAIGFVIVMIMSVGFGGVFFLLKYNHDRAAEREVEARQYEQQRLEAAERSEDSQRLGAIGGVLGGAAGDKFAQQLGDDARGQLVKSGLEKLGETVGREIGQSKRSKDFKEGLTELGEKLKKDLDRVAEQPDGESGG